MGRWALGRRQVVVEVEGQPVRVKVGPFRSKAEHDDCAVVAAGSGLAVAEVARRAELLAGRETQSGGASSLC